MSEASCGEAAEAVEAKGLLVGAEAVLELVERMMCRQDNPKAPILAASREVAEALAAVRIAADVFRRPIFITAVWAEWPAAKRADADTEESLPEGIFEVPK